jgi:hypothetical protein
MSALQICDTLLAGPIPPDVDVDADTLTTLDGYVADCGDDAVAVACRRDGVAGVAVTYLVPVDHDLAPQATQQMWWKRDRADIDTAVGGWVEMVERMADRRGIPVESAVVDGDAVDRPGWIAIQFFFVAERAGRVTEFVTTAAAMKDTLNRTSLTW